MIYTSYFSNIKNLPKDKAAVSIARGQPKWFSGRIYLVLAPTWDMIKNMNEAEYRKAYAGILSKLDPKDVICDLDGSILLCWERPGEFCHRRLVAEWIERSTGVIVPEYNNAIKCDTYIAQNDDKCYTTNIQGELF